MPNGKSAVNPWINRPIANAANAEQAPFTRERPSAPNSTVVIQATPSGSKSTEHEMRIANQAIDTRVHESKQDLVRPIKDSDLTREETLGYITYDDSTTELNSTTCTCICENAWPLRGTYVRILGATPNVFFVGRIAEGPFITPKPGAYYMLELTSMEIGGRRTAVQNRPVPGAPVKLLSPQMVQSYIGATGDFVLGRLVGQSDVEIALDSSNLNRHIGIFGTTGTGKSNTLQVITEEASRSNRCVLIFDIEGEYVAMNEPTDALKSILQEFGKRPQGVKDFQVYVPAPNQSRNADAKRFGVAFADIDLEIFSEILGLTPMERIYMFDIAKKTKEGAGSFQGYNIESVIRVLKKRIDAQVDKANFPETVAEAHMGLYTKLTVAHRSGVLDPGGGEVYSKIPTEAICRPGRITVIDVSESSDIVRNICIAHLLKEVFLYKTMHLESASILVFMEEIHTFLSKAKRRTMTATLTMLTEMARQGRKRGIGLGFVSQQPALVPSELVELCNTRFMHRISSEPNIEALRKSTANVTDSMWALLPSLGNGEALISSPKFNHSIVARIRPNMSKRMRMENG